MVACAAMGIQIRIDREQCAGTANCQHWAPDVFDVDDENIAIVLDPEAAPEADVLLAAEGCPTGAISVWRGSQQIG
jgi:ferredoxin